MPDDSGDAAPRVDPDWPACAKDGCVGRQIEGFEWCLAHLEAGDLDDVFRRFTPGADVDLRGTTLTIELLDRLLAHLTEGVADLTGRASFGRADFSYCHIRGDDFSKHGWFDGAQFGGSARFGGAQFDGDPCFRGAQFGGRAWFSNAHFGGEAWFGGAQFGGGVWFSDAQFGGGAEFNGAQFGGGVWFVRAKFDGDAWFHGAQFDGGAEFDGTKFGGDARFSGTKFGGDARFSDAQFDGDAGFVRAQVGGGTWFDGARFESVARFGPLLTKAVDVDGASFAKRVVVEVEAEGRRGDPAAAGRAPETQPACRHRAL